MQVASFCSFFLYIELDPHARGGSMSCSRRKTEVTTNREQACVESERRERTKGKTFTKTSMRL